MSRCKCFCENGKKLEKNAVIKYLFLKGNTPTRIKVELDTVYRDNAPSFTTVKFWAAEFKRGRKSLGDDERSDVQKLQLPTITSLKFTKWC